MCVYEGAVFKGKGKGEHAVCDREGVGRGAVVLALVVG